MKQQLKLNTETILSKYEHMPDADSQAVTQLIHELSVYQIELEMQNQSLKQAQEELLQSNINFYNLYHEAPVGYVIIDKHDNVTKANKAFLAILGLDAEQLLNKPLVHAFTGDSRLILTHWLGAHLMGENQIDLSINIKGLTRHLQVVKNEFSLFDKQSCRMLAFTDITREVDLESHLTLSHALINTSTDPCLVLDKQHQIFFFNPAFEKMSAYSFSVLSGQPVACLRSNRSFLNLNDIVYKLNQSEQWDGPAWLLSAQGTTLSAHINASRVRCGVKEFLVFKFSQINEQV
jgi:PAS domain S-box-containing protein